MADANWKRGLTRLCILLAVLWIAGMSWYQYDQAQQEQNDSFTIALPNAGEVRIDASGLHQYQERSSADMKRVAWIFVPPLLLLLTIPAGDWLVRGFKREESK